MFLNELSTMLSIFLPKLIILIFVKISRFLEHTYDLLDTFRSQFSISNTEHPSELPHLLEVYVLLFLVLLPRLMTSNTFLNVDSTAFLFVHSLLKRQTGEIYLHRVQLFHLPFINITFYLSSLSDNSWLLISRFKSFLFVWYHFSFITLHCIVEFVGHEVYLNYLRLLFNALRLLLGRVLQFRLDLNVNDLTLML